MLARATALRSAPLAASRCARGLPPQTLLVRTRLPLSPLAPAAPSLRSATKARGAFRDFVLGPDPEERLKDAEVKEHFRRLRAVGWTLLSAAATAANAAAAGSFWYEYVSTAALAVFFMTASELFNLLGLSLRLALIKYLMSQQP
ncbi:hypothetical protein ABPG77_003553 [Micractinium sp. CCAP 211/92]